MSTSVEGKVAGILFLALFPNAYRPDQPSAYYLQLKFPDVYDYKTTDHLYPNLTKTQSSCVLPPETQSICVSILFFPLFKFDC